MNTILFTFAVIFILLYSFLTGSRDFSVFLLVATALTAAISESVMENNCSRAVCVVTKLLCSSICASVGLYYLSLHFSSAVKVETFLYMGILCFFIFLNILLTESINKNTTNT